MNPKDLANSIIERVMKMQTFRIITPMPDDFEFNGRVPFDIKINKEGVMTCTVHALTFEEAKKQVDEYLQENSGL